VANEKKSNDIVGWIIAVVFGTSYYFYETGKNPFDSRDEVPIEVAYGYEREDNLLGSDMYKVNLTVFHGASDPISGRIIIRAYGDIFGEAGKDRNYGFNDLSNAPPGKNGGFNASFYINNAALKKDDMSLDVVKSHSTMRFVVEFQPSASETKWKTATWNFELRNGKLVTL
jgi:hypothetical protein